jgi:hypothetical protein
LSKAGVLSIANLTKEEQMQLRRVGRRVEQVYVAMAAVLFAAGCAAQPAVVQSCEGAKGCAEVLLRYYEQPVKSAVAPYESAKIQILDSKSRKEIGNACQVCDPKLDSSCKTPCKDLQNATLQDASYIILLQSNKSPGCFYFCSGGWCRWMCF